MRGKKLLATFLVGIVIVCFVPVPAGGRIPELFLESTSPVPPWQLFVLHARISFIMKNPDTFWEFEIVYDAKGVFTEFKEVPQRVDTEGKFVIKIYDSRDWFSKLESETPRIKLLEILKGMLEKVYSYIDYMATDMNTDIVAVFYSKQEIPLGYFYQGEYHLWEE